MNDAALISRHRDVKSQIIALKLELAALEKEIIARALNRPHEPLTDDHREGRRARLAEDGQSLSVRFESDVLKASWQLESGLTAQLKDISGSAFPSLFKVKKTCERAIADGAKFRSYVHSILSEIDALKLLDALKDRDKNGIAKSRAVIES